LAPDAEKVSAWELRKYLSRHVRKMRSQFKILIILLVLICLAICGHVIFYYNYLTDLRYDVATEDSKVVGAIQYRNNLVPVLVESVASFVSHEDNVFNRTVDARERELTMNQQVAEKLRESADGPVQEVLQRIMAIAEQYPLLRTNEAYQTLMQQVADAEAKILDQRYKYNDAVNLYTTAMSMFPGNIYAALFDFPTYDYFAGSPGSEWSPVSIAR
jgi:LemA protein